MDSNRPSVNKKILLVEDEIKLALVVREYLEQSYYSVEILTSGLGVVDRVRQYPPDLILLDVMLPSVDGKTICREIREFSSVPIIMLTAMVDEIDRLLGYELGADDYICKPVSPREILARVKTVLRRSGSEYDHRSVNLMMDESKRTAYYMGKVINLTDTEFRLLGFISSEEGQVFSRQKISEAIYDGFSESSERSIDTCVKKLRKKIATVTSGPSPIHSIYGAGYKYEEV